MVRASEETETSGVLRGIMGARTRSVKASLPIARDFGWGRGTASTGIGAARLPIAYGSRHEWTCVECADLFGRGDADGGVTSGDEWADPRQSPTARGYGRECRWSQAEADKARLRQVYLPIAIDYDQTTSPLHARVSRAPALFRIPLMAY